MEEMNAPKRVVFQHLDTVQYDKDIFLLGRCIDGKSVEIKINGCRIRKSNVDDFLFDLKQLVFMCIQY